jgi:hypothetical protein
MRPPTVSDPPADVRAAVKASQNATAAAAKERASALQLALADVQPPSEPSELPDDPPAAPVDIVSALTEYVNTPPPLVVVPPVEIVTVTTQPLVAQLAATVTPPVDYHAHPALSAGLIKDAVQAGIHYAVWRRANPRPSTKAMDRGTRIHKALLEREHIDVDAFVPRPHGMLFSVKEGKAWKAEQEANGLEVIEANEYAFLVGANNLVDAWTALLATSGTPWRFEAELFWQENGVDFRCKPDAYCVLPDGRPRLYSVKTTAYTVTPDQWRRQVETRFTGPVVGYDLAEYHYARGLAATHLGDPERWQEVDIAHIVCPLEGPTILYHAPVPPGLLHRIAPTWHGMVPELAAALTEPLPSGILPLTYEPSTWAARDINEIEEA